MEHTERKNNRLECYDYSQNGAYFVTICIKDRKRLLSDIVGDDAHIVLKSYGKIVEKYIRNDSRIVKYVIMPDHVHMIIQLEDGPMWASAPTSNCKRSSSQIASIVRSIKTLTTKEIGFSIWQRSYYDHVIRNQQDYDETWKYIDTNPVKWQMKKR